MTEMTKTPTRYLIDRRDDLLRENIEHLNKGEFSRYVRNCQRIKRLAAEINKRQLLREVTT